MVTFLSVLSAAHAEDVCLDEGTPATPDEQAIAASLAKEHGREITIEQRIEVVSSSDVSQWCAPTNGEFWLDGQQAYVAMRGMNVASWNQQMALGYLMHDVRLKPHRDFCCQVLMGPDAYSGKLLNIYTYTQNFPNWPGFVAAALEMECVVDVTTVEPTR